MGKINMPSEFCFDGLRHIIDLTFQATLTDQGVQRSMPDSYNASRRKRRDVKGAYSRCKLF
jgi:hypothetical protein